MFKDVSELKAFILWAKETKISALKVGEVEVHFSPLALSADYKEVLIPETPKEQLTDAQLQALKKEELDLLFHSSN